MQINKHRIIPVLILILSPLCLILFLPGTTHSRNDFVLLYTRGKTAHLVKLAGRIPTANRKKTINGKAAYALGRSCYIEHFYEKAAFYLNKSILNSGRYYEDHALYYLSKAQLELKNNKAAFKSFRRLADTFPDSIYYRQAVYHTAKLAYDMKDYKPAAKYFLRSADLGPAWYRAGRTFRGARSLEHLGRTSEAIAAYFHLLAMETYGQYNTKCLKRLEEAGQLPPDTQKQKLLYIKALIRAKRSNEAESLLKQSEKKTTSAYFKFQHALIYSWIFRRRSLWHKAYSQLAPYLNIKKLTKNERIQLLTNLYYIQKSRRKYSQALKTIKKIHTLRPSKASGLFTNLAKAVEKQPKLRWEINITAAGLFPGRHFYLSALFQELTRTSRKNNIQSVIKKAQILLKFDKERNRRSGIYYFLGKAYEKSGKQKSSINAYRASITENPLGFYHHFLKKKTKLQLNFSSNQTNVNMLCRNYFLFSNSDKKKAISHIRKLWKKLTIIKKLSTNWDKARQAAQFLEKDEQTSFRQFIKDGFYREALVEITRRTAYMNKKLYSFTTKPLLWLAGLAAKAHRPGASVYYYATALKKAGWMKEILVMDIIKKGLSANQLFPYPFRKIISKHSKHYKLDPLFTLSLIRQESSYEPKVTSWAGAVGLMQLMPTTAMEIAGRLRILNCNLLNPRINIRIGCSFLGWLKKAYKHYVHVLIGYNAGPNRINQWKRYYNYRFRRFNWIDFVESIPFDETRGYVKKVLSNLDAYKFIYQ